jgi:hypothetical protein
MEIGIYEPPRGSPSPPPPKPVSKWRTVVINTLIFTGAFLVCLAVFGRHEIVGYFEHSAESPPMSAEASATRPLSEIAVASAVLPPPNSDQAAIRSLPAEPAGQAPRKPRPLPASAPIRLPEAIPPVVDRPLP